MGQFIVGSYANPPIPRPYMGSHFFQWTANTRWATIEHMRIEHRRFDDRCGPEAPGRFECQTRFRADAWQTNDETCDRSLVLSDQPAPRHL